jgi:outer membrane protein OmpA-like peptidoglycan-associated protein
MKIVFLCLLLLFGGCNKKKTVYINTIPNESWVEEETETELKPVKQNEEPIMEFEDEKLLETSTIYFDFDRAEIKADQVKMLDKIVSDARTAPLKPLVIEGYTCPIGTDEYNYRLGERRAGSVYAYLSQHIKNPMVIISYGERSLVEIDPANYYLNRRVVIKFK